MVARVFKDRQNILVRDDIEDDEKILFSEVVNIAEKIGKPVIPAVIPTNNAFFAYSEMKVWIWMLRKSYWDYPGNIRVMFRFSSWLCSGEQFNPMNQKD